MIYYKEPSMRKAIQFDTVYYMLLETTNGTVRFLLKAPLREAQLHARLETFRNPGSTYIAPPVEGRSFSALTANQLLHLIYSLGSAPEGDYAAQVQQALALVQARDPDTEACASLEREVHRLGVPEPNLTHAAPKPVAAKLQKPKDISFQNPERPKAGTTTALVWELCDQLKAALGRLPTSKEALAECDKEGIKAGTVSVQYSKWKKVQ
jgi:hypothetical protein